MVILTHTDGDHVNGLRGLSEGVKIFSHKKAYAGHADPVGRKEIESLLSSIKEKY
ncbi:MAG: hypothetical protein H5U06_02060 [Candidatus Aminicenantes bacterium]|nr:hypothetical protein [Candidatus Aminicenantes bacterium]